MADEGEEVGTFEKMPRPSRPDQFANWLVPARNNIQREMLRLRPILVAHPYVGFPTWVVHARHLLLGACFSLWRSVFQAGVPPLNSVLAEDGRKFLDQIINNNAATYATELNAWSLEYYVENAVYRLRESRELAKAAGIDVALLPEAHTVGSSDTVGVSDTEREDFFLSEVFTPYGEWEECFLAARALITAMAEAIQESRPC